MVTGRILVQQLQPTYDQNDHQGCGQRSASEASRIKFDLPPYSECSFTSKMVASIGGRHLHSKEQFWLAAMVAILVKPVAYSLNLEMPLRCLRGSSWMQIALKAIAELTLSRLWGVPWMWPRSATSDYHFWPFFDHPGFFIVMVQIRDILVRYPAYLSATCLKYLLYLGLLRYCTKVISPVYPDHCLMNSDRCHFDPSLNGPSSGPPHNYILDLDLSILLSHATIVGASTLSLKRLFHTSVTF